MSSYNPVHIYRGELYQYQLDDDTPSFYDVNIIAFVTFIIKTTL